MKKIVTVSMYPASAAQDDNPFINILASGLRDNNVRVIPFHPGVPQLMSDALHVHWLEKIFWGRLASRSKNVQAHLVRGIVGAARRYRAASKPVIWTAHNLRPHDRMDPEKQEIFSRLETSFMPLVTDCVVMDESISDSVKSTYPQLESARFHIIPHPNFTQEFERFQPLQDVRAVYGLPSDTPLLVSVGKVRAYKGLPGLVNALRQSKRDFRLVIAGSGDKAESDLIRAEIAQDKRFIFDNRTLAAKEVVSLLSSADAAVFNFSSILNSGSVLSALSVSTPVICPSAGAMSGLKTRLGPIWVRLYDPPLTTAFLDNQIATLTHHKGMSCDLNYCAPRVVGARHAEIYRKPN